VEQEVEKIKKSLNLLCNIHPLFTFNEHIPTNAEQQAQEQQALENDRVGRELEEELKDFDLKLATDMLTIVGENKDEVSLLNEISGRNFQGIP